MDKENTKIPTKIIDINTECLIEIFKNLNYQELLDLTKVYDGFYDAIEYVVMHGNFTFCISTSENKQLKCKLIEEFLKLFGNKIKRLNFELIGWFGKKMYWLLRMHLETLIKFYCMHGNVQYCSFDNFRLRPRFVSDKSNFFKSLQSISMLSAIPYHRDLNWFLNGVLSDNTKEIEIADRHFIFTGLVNVFAKINSSQLESVKIKCLPNPNPRRRYSHRGYYDSDDSYNNDSTDDEEEEDPDDHYKKMGHKIVDLPANTTLKYLSVDRVGVIPNVHKYFPCIEIVNKISDNHYSWNSISKLRNLKKLTFSVDQMKYDEVFTFIKKLAECDTLQTLHLYMGSRRREKNEFETKISNIVRQMTSLPSLRFD